MKHRPLLLFILLLLSALALTIVGYSRHVPLSRIVAAILDPAPDSFGEIYLHYALLPRIFVALSAGAALSLSGVIFQQVLKNPLAEPSTMGLLSGAQLAITLAALAAPGMAVWSIELAAITGALATLGLVMLLASRGGFSPVTMLLAGMIVSFFAGTASVVLALFNHEYLRSVFIWASGSLVQNDFSNAVALAWRLAVCIPMLVLLARPLAIAGLDDASGRSLGVPVRTLRLAALFIASVLAAFVVARVGVIAFIGLAAPHLARFAGARTFSERLLWSPLLGGALLLLADGSVLVMARYIAEVPTGTATAFFGAFLLLVLLKNMPLTALHAEARTPTSSPRHRPHFALFIAIVMMVVVVVFSLSEQLFIDNLPSAELFSGRWPRVLAAASAGAMLALAGTIMQSVTANPLASPEGLGVSSGAALGIIATLLLAGTFSPLVMLLGGIGGALATFLVMMAITRKSAHAPGPVLLAGAAIGTFAATLITVVLASGDPRAVYVLAWSMGPTYRATAITGLAGLAVLVVALALVPLVRRWLQILPLGDQAARELGLAPRRSRTALLSLSAVLTASATLIVGPLSFVGLIAPHIAAMTAPPKPLNRALCATAIGASLMTAADWLGRSIHFPYEIPAGVLAAFVGGPYFLWLLYRRHP
ncbi:iron-hydroxamate transporter permease subunit [Agrobacterium albertimagni AOL15]|uniref:Iron-hydroxamate transporter permease subunit n=1 Tax=Agrobacterium albertimagni AOL15 TaxID=1156935 RepID=K2Q4K1_9HYPH|nr:Fe(3+)-hydroxamate ABC transporter permease FhuB [Agrobacterium albertimagni]EKF58664.1 iron-hydroxamate transporter permease subunit [Agrobacterium albertimagni AOL15]